MQFSLTWILLSIDQSPFTTLAPGGKSRSLSPITFYPISRLCSNKSPPLLLLLLLHMLEHTQASAASYPHGNCMSEAAALVAIVKKEKRVSCTSRGKKVSHMPWLPFCEKKSSRLLAWRCVLNASLQCFTSKIAETQLGSVRGCARNAAMFPVQTLNSRLSPSSAANEVSLANFNARAQEAPRTTFRCKFIPYVRSRSASPFQGERGERRERKRERGEREREEREERERRVVDDDITVYVLHMYTYTCARACLSSSSSSRTHDDDSGSRAFSGEKQA